MAASIDVNISGPLLSSLFYENLKRSGDQEGFLLGEIGSRITDTISDSQLNTEKEETTISVYSILPCYEVFSFYNSKANIIEENLHRILGTRFKDVVGWYRFRREMSTDVLSRESFLHKRLAEALPYSQILLFAVFTANPAANNACHNFDYIFYRLVEKSFVGTSVNVVNLGDTANAEYKLHRDLVVNPNAGLSCKVLKDISSSHSKQNESLFQPASIVSEIQQSIHNSLKVVCKQLFDSEMGVYALEKEVNELRELVNASQEGPAHSSISGTSKGLQPPLLPLAESTPKAQLTVIPSASGECRQKPNQNRHRPCSNSSITSPSSEDPQTKMEGPDVKKERPEIKRTRPEKKSEGNETKREEPETKTEKSEVKLEEIVKREKRERPEKKRERAEIAREVREGNGNREGLRSRNEGSVSQRSTQQSAVHQRLEESELSEMLKTFPPVLPKREAPCKAEVTSTRRRTSDARTKAEPAHEPDDVIQSVY